MLFLGKANDAHTLRALDYAHRRIGGVVHHLGTPADPLPDGAATWSGHLVISYLSPWIVPASVLARAETAINFHPAPPEYPGIGCVNFALYDNAMSYGAMVHHMAPRVDTGPVIAVKRFPIAHDDTVDSVLARTYDHLIVLFYETVDRLARGWTLPVAESQWTRRPFTRRELNALAALRHDMTDDEIARRRRATTFGAWAPQFVDDDPAMASRP